jgi:hypothetical protein
MARASKSKPAAGNRERPSRGSCRTEKFQREIEMKTEKAAGRRKLAARSHWRPWLRRFSASAPNTSEDNGSKTEGSTGRRNRPKPTCAPRKTRAGIGSGRGPPARAGERPARWHRKSKSRTAAGDWRTVPGVPGAQCQTAGPEHARRTKRDGTPLRTDSRAQQWGRKRNRRKPGTRRSGAGKDFCADTRSSEKKIKTASKKNRSLAMANECAHKRKTLQHPWRTHLRTVLARTQSRVIQI